MDKKMLMAVAGAMSPPSYLNYGHFVAGKGSTSNKYKPHQGKQECARRLKVYSVAWHSSMTYV